jgi:UDP-glucose 4-epimerase
VRFLVTGGAGFIGSHVCQKLNDRGHEVVVLDDFSTGFHKNLDNLEITVLQGSVVDRDAVRMAAQDIDAVAHLAALGSVPRSIADPTRSFSINALGTLNILEVARESGARVVFASSSSVYGSVPTLPRTEDLPTRPMSPYGASKLSAEGLVLAYGQAYQMRNLPLRFFNVYGPRQSPSGPYAAVIPKFITAALSGLPIEIHGDGTQTRDFTFVDTVVNIVTRALEEAVASQIPVNVAFGQPTSINELATLIESLLGIKLERKILPGRVGDISASDCTPESIRKLFPEIQDLGIESGLHTTIDAFRDS